MVKRKFEHGVSEQELTKKQKLPVPPRIGKRPIVPMKLSWITSDSDVPVRVLLDPGANVPIISDDLVWRKRIPIVVRETPQKINNFTGEDDDTSGLAYTFSLILSCGQHYVQQSFEVSPLQDDHDIILPWWWSLKPPTAYLMTGKSEDLVFNSHSCINCTKEAVADFTIEYDNNVAAFGENEKCVGCIGSLKVDDDFNMEIDHIGRIPKHYHMWQSIFNGTVADVLPKHTSYDHAIDIQEGKEPPWGPIYALSEVELETLKEYLKKMLDAGKIRPSKSPAGAPILFIPKAHGRGLRLCVDYRGLNRVTILNRYALPLMDELRDRIQGAKIFTKIDLKAGFNLIRIKHGDEWKTAFRCRYGHYEYTVMPFGLANAPASFQAMINAILRDLIDAGVVAYIDDILIYSKTEEEHIALVQEVLRRLSDNNLAIEPEKCDWHVSRVDYLGYVISEDGIEMSDEKVQSVRDWEAPKSVKDIQSFLGFANFYRRFIEGYSKLTRPLTDLTKKSEKFVWSDECQRVFQELKDRFTSAPILRHFDPVLPTIVECDASDFAIGAVLSQKTEVRLHPITFHSRKLNKHEINYDIHDKEMLAIVSAFKTWRRYLEGASHTVSIYTDHDNLNWFAQGKPLNRRQARWALELDGFDFVVIHRPGAANGKADALSRRSEYRPEKGGLSYQPVTQVFKPGQWVSGDEPETVLVSSVQLSTLRPVVKMSPSLIEEIVGKAAVDPIYQEEYAQAKKDHAVQGEVLSEITYADGLLYYKGKIWVPNDIDLKKLIMEAEHDTNVAGHMGMDKTTEMIRRNFFWPKMAEEIEDYVRSCEDCQRNKASRHKRHGTLHPLELSYSPWDSISMDFIVQLPLSEGCVTIWVVVDRFTKMAHFIPIKEKEKTAEGCAKLFLSNVWRLHGLPSSIVSDRDSVFTSSFWAELMKKLDIKRKMSTAFHPQTDGQTERVNQTLEHYLRQFCNYEQNDWYEMLPLAEYCYNNSVTTATQLSPFYANYGFHPRTNWPVEMESKDPASKSYAHWMTSVHELCASHLKITQERMSRYYDKTKSAPPQYSVGDLVMLNGKNIRTRRAAKKLDNKLFGPFKVNKVVGTRKMSVGLELPKRWRVHNVFHVSLLEPYRQSAKGLREPPVAVTERGFIDKFGQNHEVGYDVDGAQVLEGFEVEEIMGSQFSTDSDRVLYLVRWVGYPEKSEWTEEPLDHLPRAMVKAFHKRHPSAPKDAKLKK